MAGEVIALGARLRQRREELGLTQAQVARELEVARTAYRLWEMEAARPSPERWRAVAKWLGISVTALLLAGELLDEGEAVDADTAVGPAGLTGTDWDARSGSFEGDYFSQERTMIAQQASSGDISADQAARLHAVLARIQDATASSAARAAWHPGRFRKRVPRSELAPTVARAALAATAIGVPPAVLDDAALLISELVTNSVKHTHSDWIDLGIVLDADRLRIEVADQSAQSFRPRTADGEGGWGLTFVVALAHRWGVERSAAGKTIWIELDLTSSP